MLNNKYSRSGCCSSSISLQHLFLSMYAYNSYWQVKKENNSEAIHNEVVGQAHMENYALKVFLYADNEDRASRFNK